MVEFQSSLNWRSGFHSSGVLAFIPVFLLRGQVKLGLDCESQFTIPGPGAMPGRAVPS